MNYIITLRQLPNSRSIVQPVIRLWYVVIYDVIFIYCVYKRQEVTSKVRLMSQNVMILNIGWQISISRVSNHNTAVPLHLWIKAAVHICGHQMSPKKHVLKSFSSEPFFNTWAGAAESFVWPLPTPHNKKQNATKVHTRLHCYSKE